MPGDIAEAILEGLFCQVCGEVIEDMLDDGVEPPGYPRTCQHCLDEDEVTKEGKYYA